jgi:predicted DNA-binding transcriptional regulator YafY
MYQLQRLIEIDLLVRAGKAPTPQDLAERLGVSRRQIFLDRNRLIEDLGAPLLHDRKRGGWVYSDLTWVLPTSLLTEGEVLAFFLSLEIARSGGNGGIEEVLQSAVAKIARGLGDAVSVDLNTLREGTSFALSPAARVNSQVALALSRAHGTRRKVLIRYFTASRGETGERVIHPYHLYFPRGEALVFAFDEKRGEVRSFNVARIKHHEVLKAHFEKRADFDPAQMRRSMLWAEAGQTLYDVAVRFDAYQARYIRERVWHPDQVIDDEADGGATLRFPSGGLAEVARFVLGFGAHAQVIEPAELRDIVVSHLEKMGRIYWGTNKETSDD